MKKLIALLLVMILAAGMVACGNTEEAPKEPVNLTGTMEETINAINEAHAQMELPLMVMALDMTDVDSLTYYTGLTSTDGISDAAICEPMMGQAYSLVLVRAADATKAAEVAQHMFDNVDMRKWVCVEADTKIAASYGDVAMFFMVNSQFSEQVTTATMLEAFKTVCGGDVTVIE